MGASRTVLIAGGGIGGLTAAIALAQREFRVVVMEQAPQITEAGAGLQLSPNATRALFRLGLREQFVPKIVAPEAVVIRLAHSGREILRMPLGAEAEFRYGTPYWTIHRGDLQTILRTSAEQHPDIELHTGARVEDFAIHSHGVTAHVRSHMGQSDARGIALVGADGLWSELRVRLGDGTTPRFGGRTAWRAVIPTSAVAPEFRTPSIHIWLGRQAHLVHYPVRGGSVINIVAIMRDTWRGREWSVPGAREELLGCFRKSNWAAAAQALLACPDHWLKWSLFDRPPLPRWGTGPMTLLGDAAHPMLPFLAQGAGMAVEDAVTLADCMAAERDEPGRAMRRYEGLRRGRTARAQRMARLQGRLYHLRGLAALARNLRLRLMSGEKLRARYDWLYDWRPA